MNTRLSLLLPAMLVAAATAQAADQTLIAKGEYLSRAGDCIACHTVKGGEPFAGGLPIESPFGTIYSTNITPSKTAGIGNYTLEQFDDAVRHGERADGGNLYPAMPYPDYSVLSDDDVKAMYAYFMEGVKPVDKKAPETDLSFPFNQRWGIGMWDLVFGHDAAFEPHSQNPFVNRGAYLVQGLGHCGSCHSPRGVAFQEKGYDETDANFLSGGKIGIWEAPSLRGGSGAGPLVSWDKAEIVDYLANGRNDRTAVGGEMTSVIEHSLSYLTQADLEAIADYLKSLPGAGKEVLLSAEATEKTAAQLNSAKVPVDSGARVYLDNCGACHFTRGQGASRVFPQLDGNALVNAEDPSGLIHVILAGARLPSTKGAPEELAMPAFGWRLNDEDVAKLATFVRQAWNNHAAAVTAKQVAAVRETIPATELNATKPTLN
ncbi:cytochrome c [Shewanella avicenniae]|uniref:Cytochrome c n=1 Tax=Shewanella avicenniae TaxID=2814294 RepID=A0ABX7QUW9_9GAMM|nr:cytochrome c [Shewanella avicenniae]QSX34822.1 cytochrome c [Shewanella avicenniae]